MNEWPGIQNLLKRPAGPDSRSIYIWESGSGRAVRELDPKSAKLLKRSTFKAYPGFPHGMPTTNGDQMNADLLAFVQTQAQTSEQPASKSRREETVNA